MGPAPTITSGKARDGAQADTAKEESCSDPRKASGEEAGGGTEAVCIGKIRDDARSTESGSHQGFPGNLRLTYYRKSSTMKV